MFTNNFHDFLQYALFFRQFYIVYVHLVCVGVCLKQCVPYKHRKLARRGKGSLTEQSQHLW